MIYRFFRVTHFWIGAVCLGFIFFFSSKMTVNAESFTCPDFKYGQWDIIIRQETSNYYYRKLGSATVNVPSTSYMFQNMQVGHQYILEFDIEIEPVSCVYKINSSTSASIPCTGSEFSFSGENSMTTPDGQYSYPLKVGHNSMTFNLSSSGNVKLSFNVLAYVACPVSVAGTKYFWGGCNIWFRNIVIDDNTPLSDNEALNELVKGQEVQIEQSQQFHDEDKSSAVQAGSDMGGFATQLENLKGTWAILWYPIEFTNTVMGVFTDGTSGASYRSIYSNVSGFTYDDSSGLLKPVYKSPVATIDAVDVPSGTGLTFPSFEIMGVKVWDAYTFDLAGLKDKFPVVFDSLYVIVSILEVLWFVGFLRSKYEEVFG